MLYAAITFLLKSALCSALFLGYYWLFLRNRKLNQYNRIFLLGAVVGSLVVPLLHFEWHRMPQATIHPAVRLMEITNGAVSEPEVMTKSGSQIPVEAIIIGVYATVCVVLFALMVLQICRVYKIKRNGIVVRKHGFDLVNTKAGNAPFSFMGNLFWRDDIDIESKEGQQILWHEMAHIRQMHSLDKIGMQLVTSIFWINPCFWLIQKELSQIHEFIADEAAINDNDTEAFAHMLLQTHYGNAFRDVVHPFFYSPIKRRLLMLNQKKSKYNKLRKLMVAPIVVGSLLLFSFKVKNDAGVERAFKPIKLALDAGHGGNDNGASGPDGVLEKDLNLKIAKKIARLAEDYNITIVPVRLDDNYVPLEDRATIANKANADVFMSIHVNSGDNHDAGKLKDEISLDERNIKTNESNELAASLSSQFYTMNRPPKITQKHLLVLRNAQMPAVLIECGNIMDKNNLAAFNNDAELDKFCRGILSAIVAYKNYPSNSHR